MAELGLFAAALLAGLIAQLGGADSQCYVCVPREGSGRLDVAREFNTSASRMPLCEDFDRSSSLDAFRMRCPEPFSGCTTQINGSHVTRTCANMLASDCKVANRVRYCYCKEPLCNGRLSRATPPSDDEDIAEHSGEGPLPQDTSRVALEPFATTARPPPSSGAASNRTPMGPPLVAWLLLALISLL